MTQVKQVKPVPAGFTAPELESLKAALRAASWVLLEPPVYVTVASGETPKLRYTIGRICAHCKDCGRFYTDRIGGDYRVCAPENHADGQRRLCMTWLDRRSYTPDYDHPDRSFPPAHALRAVAQMAGVEWP